MSNTVKIILISERYDPEVIITANWLSNEYGVDITAFSVSLYKLEQDTFVNFEQRLPLKELDDVYEKRGSAKVRIASESKVTWEDVLPKLKYPFAQEALDYCLQYKEGDASRRRFIGLRKNHKGFDKVSVLVREKYLNIYLDGQPDNAEEILQQKFGDIEIMEWARGFSFKIDMLEQFQNLKDWLG